MKYLFVGFLFVSGLAFADKDISQEQKDFFVICESFKFAKALKKNPAFSEVERAVMVAQMQTALVASAAVKNTLSAIAQTTPSERIKLLNQAAKEVGIKKWDCPAIEESNK